jgi:hypothetical protein
MVESPTEFFSERGFRLSFETDEDSVVWAHLLIAEEPERGIFHPNYGSGSSEAEAAESAVRKWRMEQRT